MLRASKYIPRLISTRGGFFKAENEPSGYYVLVPEIGEAKDAFTTANFLRPDNVPEFNGASTSLACIGVMSEYSIRLENYMQQLNEELSQGANLKPAELFRTLDEKSAMIDIAWGIAKASYIGRDGVMTTDVYLSLHKRARHVRSLRYWSKPIFDAIQASSEEDCSPQERRLRAKYLLEGRLNGLAGKGDNLDLKSIIYTLSKECTKFVDNVNNSIRTSQVRIEDRAIVKDFPKLLTEAANVNFTYPEVGPWLIKMQPPMIEEFLRYCPNRLYRWNAWQMNVRMNGQSVDKRLRNSVHLETIRSLRHQQANMLGFANYAEMSMQTKMVKSLDNLQAIFDGLRSTAGPVQAEEMTQLQKYCSDKGFAHDLEVYDVAYWRNRYLVNEHGLDQERLKEYFPLPHVLSALFELSEKIFNVKIVARADIRGWNPLVKYYEIYDCDAEQSSTPAGAFYVDCYSDKHKYGKNLGWMVNMRNRNEAAKLSPLGALIFNFSPPSGNIPTLLNDDDLRLVFKIFGTALQHLLTRSEYVDIAGLSNNEWDASKVAGLVMANFVDRPDCLARISQHFLTGDAIDAELAQKAQLEKTYLAGYNLCQELYISHLDIELHKSKSFWLDIVRKLWPLYNVLPLDKIYAKPCSMIDIVAGDWPAAHFSHVYAKMLAADISSKFKDTKDIVTGKRYKDTFLVTGGSQPAEEVFRNFQGRDPSLEPLLTSLKLNKPEHKPN